MLSRYLRVGRSCPNLSPFRRAFSQNPAGTKSSLEGELEILGRKFARDEWTNVTPKILSYLDRKIYIQKYHPIAFLNQKIINYFYKSFVTNRGNPVFSIYNDLNPIVTLEQNFDSLLIPADHPSRERTDCYYIDKEHLLRAHMTAHQLELIRMGLNHFLMLGDVYRRDQVDSTHFPVFHQADGVRLATKYQLSNMHNEPVEIFDKNAKEETPERQSMYTAEATKLMETELKTTLAGLAANLFGKDVKYRWVETTFPFTHPSWELEVFHEGQWLEVLGCGIMRHQILQKGGVGADRIGWAFGVGIERLAMHLYSIPDIRLFWSQDTGFLNQFKIDDLDKIIKYKPVSSCPQLINDISFWLPTDNDIYSSNDFYDLARTVGGDLVEQIELVDKFVHPKTQRKSHCYRIVYRHMERTLTQEEVTVLHKEIETRTRNALGVEIR